MNSPVTSPAAVRLDAESWFTPRAVFIAAFIIALAFALATDRAWEDYWITLRSSKNLIAGEGLVYHPGERVHTFTSPLGVLIPAFCHGVTFQSSDEAALWVFHVLGALAFALAVCLMFITTTRLRFHPAAAALLALALMLDAKSVDFSINGMETGFMLLFVSHMLWAVFASERHQGLHLGLASGGLMWTRPDGAIYIAALGLGVMLFSPMGQTRRQWMRTLGIAALVCAAVYLPWFAWAWSYYGTPVPHTITAKANAAGVKTLWGALQTWLMLPASMFRGVGSLDGLFMPSYAFFGGWPAWLLPISRFLAGLACLVWLLPRQRAEVRVVSFASSVLVAYLGYFPGLNPAPWYLPAPAWLALFSLGGLLACFPHRAVFFMASAWLGISAWFLISYAEMSAVEQKRVEEGNRRVIGEWLQRNARPGDTLFLECLGYIGYYSGLKTYDYPGLSSPEVVRVSKRSGLQWHRLIAVLKPSWLALRPQEAVAIMQADPALLTRDYRERRLFDVSGEVEHLDVYGQGLLAFDSVFIVYQREEEAP